MKIKIKTELLSLLLLLLPLLHELCKCAACSAADKTEHWRHTHACVCVLWFFMFFFSATPRVWQLYSELGCHWGWAWDSWEPREVGWGFY